MKNGSIFYYECHLNDGLYRTISYPIIFHHINEIYVLYFNTNASITRKKLSTYCIYHHHTLTLTLNPVYQAKKKKKRNISKLTDNIARRQYYQEIGLIDSF